jgi:predicted SnoaL-like aldol condensation-catalyzing enzyme
MDYQRIINTAYRLLNAIDSLSTQVEQMQGMFDDSDGAIERSLDRGEKATEEGTKLVAALEQEKLKHISLAQLLEEAEDLLGKNVDAWEDEEDSVKEEHWDLIRLNSEYFKRKYQREAQAVASAEIEVKHPEPAPAEPSPAPAPERKPYSLILSWNSSDPEQGTYAWSGLAEDLTDAIERAQLEASDGDGEEPEDHVIEVVEGVNIWASLELLAALKKAESFISGFEGDEMQEGIDEMLAEIRAAIKRGECGE